ncbi:carbamate kinase-like protein [Escherichia coli]|uniref:Carbamate kinase-like protein n=1 Tax=Escherichia coli TaxID=562 RepID=A0A377DHH2_ECOLX|nr:carbamate kinase-like protein [Escherichia coli]
MKELVVVAIGGNSIIKDNASQSIEHQAEAVKPLPIRCWKCWLPITTLC